MAKINIITEPKPKEGHSWILRRSAEEIKKYSSHDINILSYLDKEVVAGDIHYFINYGTYYDGLDGIKIGHFTHLEENGRAREMFLKSIPKFDYYTVTCDITARILMQHKADPDRIYKIPYGSDDRLDTSIVFGVVGRTYPSGRKGEYLVEHMVNEGYNVKAWGKGWPCRCEDDWRELPAFYKSLNYLVVTSLNEGGPVPVIDAIRAGIPVIAPNVGWCWELPVIRYEKGSWESLNSVLKKLNKAPTWSQWGLKHNELFKMCLNVSE